jgi:TrmH family RNA methyltransferase
MPSRAQAKRWRALKRRKGRAEHGLFLAEGHRLVSDLLASGLAVRHLLYTDEADEEPAAAAVVERARRAGVPAEQVDRGELGEFADTVTPQSVLAVGEIPTRERSELAGGDLVVLDAVQDPGNAGTILRTAEALGAAGAVSLKGTVDLWNPKTVRASAGALFRLPVLDDEWPEAGRWIREAGLPLWAADAAGEDVGRGDRVPPRVALVLGNEGAGVREAILEAADRRVAVRLPGGAESLNVAVAAALLMDRIFSARRA